MNIIVMGQVGSGKSTQARLIADQLGLSYLNVGDLLYFKSKDPNYLRIVEQMNKGELVDEDLVTGLVEGHLKQEEHKRGVVIDGFPRSLKQAKELSLDVNNVVYIMVSDKISEERLLKRKRSDDTKTTIKKRLKTYHKTTEPILSYYDNKNILLKVDGERSIKDITIDVIQKITINNNE